MHKRDNMHCQKCCVPSQSATRALERAGVSYKDVLPESEWLKAKAFIRAVEFLKKHAKPTGNSVSLETIRAAVDKLLDGRAIM